MSSPIDPTPSARSADYTVITTAVEPPVLVGCAGQIVLVESTVRSTAFGKETIERYELSCGQDSIAKAFMDDCLAEQTCIDVERKKRQAENSIIEVTWAYDRDDAEWVPGADQRLWDFEIQDTSQPLASHPYFGRHSSIGSAHLDTLMKEMGRCDQTMALGKDYKSESVLDDIQEIMSRYAGLRFFGVDEHNPITIMLSIRYRLYQSQTEGDGGNAVTVWPWLFHGINRVIDLSVLSPPGYITSALTSLQEWVYDNTGSNTKPALNEAGFVWIRNKPLVKLSGRNPNGPSDVTEYLLGVQQASEILHPSINPGETGWDPVKVVT